MKVYLNGKLVDEEEAKISVFDHGLLYGDGVFEGIRAYQGNIFRLEQHLNRLFDSAKMIMLKIPLSKSEIVEVIKKTLQANNLKDAYIRLVITRGEGDLGLDPDNCNKPTIFVIADKITLYPQEMYENGLEIITVPVRRNLIDALDPRIKSLNYLNNILAKLSAKQNNIKEALMLNKDGYVAECSGDNIFIIKNNILITPPCSVGCLEGITRQVVIEIAEKIELKTKEVPFTQGELYIADECFLTGTAAEVIPVVKVDGRIIGDGKPGAITKRIIKEFKELTQRGGD